MGDEVVPMLKRESRFFVGPERSGIQTLTDVLEHLHSFLEVADAKTEQEAISESIKSWLQQMNGVVEVKGCVEVEDLLKLSQLLQDKLIVDFLGAAGQQFRRLNAGHSLASGNGNSKASRRYINEDGMIIREEEVATRTGTVGRQNRKPFYSFIEEYVGSKAEDVTAWLMKAEPTRSVISLVGPTGTGKTIIARRVYNSAATKVHFDLCAWIDVSRLYEITEVLKVMIRQIPLAGKRVFKELDRMPEAKLMDTLRRLLASERYMFVFDDVRKEFWHALNQGLPDNYKGSRIIFTARSYTVVASSPDHSLDYVLELGSLSLMKSWELFCQIDFQDEPSRRCPRELKEMSLEIAEMCKSFPLPIRAIAGRLSTKEKVVSERQTLDSNFRGHFKHNLHSPDVLHVLGLCIEDLPLQLRSCFLFLSIFPVGTLIPNDKLFKLWIAEGFIEEKIGKTLEEVAEEYLNELIHRDMVQACPGFFGLEKFCQLHSLIHKMARAKAKELDFCRVWDDENSSFRRKGLHTSIVNADKVLEKFEGTSFCSVFLFNIGTLHRSFLVTLIEQRELLTLLDLEYVPIDNLPETVGYLVNLKYLSLKNTKVSMLPKTIEKLKNLQNLDVRNTLLIELPKEINSLKNLRHLLASVYDDRTNEDSTRGVRMKGGIGFLEKLQTLMFVEVDPSSMGLLEGLVKLPRLKKLGISGLTTEVTSALCPRINKIRTLKSLTLHAMDKFEILDLQNISSPLLQCVVLKGRLQRLPYWIFCRESITVLVLSLSRLFDDPLVLLSFLPNLESLWLDQAYEGEKLHFEDIGFKRLKLLVLSNMDRLRVVEIEQGALPLVEELRIGPTPRMNEVPLGIQHLKNLNVLASYDMPREFVLSMQPHGGSDYLKVEHVPSVLFLYEIRRGRYMWYKLGDLELLDHLQGLATRANVVSKHEHNNLLSFCHSDDEEDDGIAQLSFIGARSSSKRNSVISQKSFSSNVFTDDYIAQLSSFGARSSSKQYSVISQKSFSSTIFTDDFEE